MTNKEARHEFSLYFRDLVADAKRDGWKPNRQAEWEFFLEAKIEQGELPAEAIYWGLQ